MYLALFISGELFYALRDETQIGEGWGYGSTPAVDLEAEQMVRHAAPHIVYAQFVPLCTPMGNFSPNTPPPSSRRPDDVERDPDAPSGPASRRERAGARLGWTGPHPLGLLIEVINNALEQLTVARRSADGAASYRRPPESVVGGGSVPRPDPHPNTGKEDRRTEPPPTEDRDATDSRPSDEPE